MRKPAAIVMTAAFIISFSFADTFTNLQTGEVLHGYKLSKTEGPMTQVKIIEKESVELNLAQWRVEPDRKGRNNRVSVLTIDGPIINEIETEAFENALMREADNGPLFVLLELDTPGGRIDLAQRISAAITNADNVQVIVYVKGGANGGALSAGVAISLSADKIYMADNTVMGAATMITGRAQTMKKAFGEEVGEKFDSAWRARLASLAEQNGRSGMLAKAMVDKDIEVIEVKNQDERLFIDPVNIKPSYKPAKTWSKKGSLLTLTTEEALNCGFADGTAQSREELLRKENADNAQLDINNDVQEAAYELKRAEGQLERIRKSVDLKIKKSQMPMYQAEALKLMRDARREFAMLVGLARKYPDLNLDQIMLENELNTIEASYQQLKKESRRR
ncbi:MAG: hypothetical protein JW804_03355 [Sedimentisphaerales bacterium]|nr:hypothetical protein [Sedimentisphaerales bacterium]